MRRLGGVLLAAAVAATAWQAPDAFRTVHAQAAAGAAATPLERELMPARSVDIDPRALVLARTLIPPDVTFAVVTGDRAEVSSQVTLLAVPAFAGYWLLPRRRVTEPGDADWVLSYGGDLDALGLEYARVVDVAPGIAVAEVRR